MDLDVVDVVAIRRLARPPATTVLCGLRTPPCRIALAPSAAVLLLDIMVSRVAGASRSLLSLEATQVQEVARRECLPVALGFT